MNKDINVTPDLEPTTNLGPFKFFALTNFPYIEQTFDTLTNYELMCKIAEQLNKFIQNNNATNENVINLYNAFVSLQKYVNDYFDDLNVQNEVNTKLDQMASDGTLETIINENIFNELNTNLENLTNKVGSETLPSPDSSVSQNINILNNKIGDEELPNPEESVIANINSLNEEIESNELTELIIFGDSWSDPTVANVVYPNIIANQLKLNLTNYAKSGANIIGSRTIDFDNQIELFNTSGINKNKVKYILMLGGINDFRSDTTASNLRIKITQLEQQLQTMCPNAKILYVSNCQFPMSKAQTSFWIYVHNSLSAGGAFASLNLEGFFSTELMNSTLFHLTEPGQELLAVNLMVALTGLGSFIKYGDSRTFSNKQGTVSVNTQLLNKLILIHVRFTPKQSLTQYHIAPDNTRGPLNYGNDVDKIASLQFPGYQQVAIDLSNTDVAIAGQNALNVNQVYNFIIPLII